MNAEIRIQGLQQEVTDLKGQLKKTERTLDQLFIAAGRAEQIARANAFIIYAFQHKMEVEKVWQHWRGGDMVIMKGIQEIMNGKEAEYFAISG